MRGSNKLSCLHRVSGDESFLSPTPFLCPCPQAWPWLSESPQGGQAGHRPSHLQDIPGRWKWDFHSRRRDWGFTRSGSLAGPVGAGARRSCRSRAQSVAGDSGGMFPPWRPLHGSCGQDHARVIARGRDFRGQPCVVTERNLGGQYGGWLLSCCVSRGPQTPAPASLPEGLIAPRSAGS